MKYPLTTSESNRASCPNSMCQCNSVVFIHPCKSCVLKGFVQQQHHRKATTFYNNSPACRPESRRDLFTNGGQGAIASYPSNSKTLTKYININQRALLNTAEPRFQASCNFSHFCRCWPNHISISCPKTNPFLLKMPTSIPAMHIICYAFLRITASPPSSSAVLEGLQLCPRQAANQPGLA